MEKDEMVELMREAMQKRMDLDFFFNEVYDTSVTNKLLTKCHHRILADGVIQLSLTPEFTFEQFTEVVAKNVITTIAFFFKEICERVDRSDDLEIVIDECVDMKAVQLLAAAFLSIKGDEKKFNEMIKMAVFSFYLLMSAKKAKGN